MPKNALPNLIIPKDEARKLIEKQIIKGEEISAKSPFEYNAYRRVEDELLRWLNYNIELLRRIFDNTSIADEYINYIQSISEYLTWVLVTVGAEKATNKLKAILDRLELIPVVKRESAVDIPTTLRVMKILGRFHIVCKQLESRQRKRPPFAIKDEYDVQDLLYALLKIEFDDIRKEDSTPKVAGAVAHMDLLLKNEQIIIEIKMTREGLDMKKLGEELLIDIAKYKEHKDCKTLICFIYDPINRLKNPAGLARDLEGQSTEETKVLVHIQP